MLSPRRRAVQSGKVEGARQVRSSHALEHFGGSDAEPYQDDEERAARDTERGKANATDRIDSVARSASC
jgi:hypothetical protein